MRQRDPAGPAAWVPELAGVLTADQVLATGRAIESVQRPDGAIGWPDGQVDAWNHVECAMALSVAGRRDAARRAYDWLLATQRPDGSWHRTLADGSCDQTAESNHAAYCAVGAWHELLVSGDSRFAARMWPAVRAGIGFALGLQTPHGEIIWRRQATGAPDFYALLAGSSSMHSSLRCAIALADYLGEPQPDWELAADQLAHAVACHPEAFADKSRFAMDWYYPVLGGPVRGELAARRLAGGWASYVVPGLGVRCVSDQPWVTAAETAELAITLDALGDGPRAAEVLDQIQRLRDADGSYWTGWQYADGRHYPNEHSAYTAAAVVLAADALSRATGGAAVFRDAGADPSVTGQADQESCGCQPQAGVPAPPPG